MYLVPAPIPAPFTAPSPTQRLVAQHTSMGISGLCFLSVTFSIAAVPLPLISGGGQLFPFSVFLPGIFFSSVLPAPSSLF